MSNATPSLASTRITSLLDANSFVEIGIIQQEILILTWLKQKHLQTV